jgi:hypothetical protein
MTSESDIVERLREPTLRAAPVAPHQAPGPAFMDVNDALDLMREAADEIERLRAIIASGNNAVSATVEAARNEAFDRAAEAIIEGIRTQDIVHPGDAVAVVLKLTDAP